MTTKGNDTVNSTIEILHPAFAARVKLLAEIMGDIVLLDPTGAKYRFEVFEGIRSPERQNYLLSKGTTKARAWQSAHQYGLAVDFAGRFVDDKKWTWEASLDWKRLKIEAGRVGLIVPIAWDRGHVESLLWGKLRKHLL